MIHLTRLKTSGTKIYCLATADDEQELRRLAERLNEEIHGKGNQPRHLDLSVRKRDLALKYGAREAETQR